MLGFHLCVHADVNNQNAFQVGPNRSFHSEKLIPQEYQGGWAPAQQMKTL